MGEKTDRKAKGAYENRLSMIDDLGACVVLGSMFCFMPFIYALLVAIPGGVFLFRERQNNSLLYHTQSAITVLRRTFRETKQNKTSMCEPIWAERL